MRSRAATRARVAARPPMIRRSIAARIRSTFVRVQRRPSAWAGAHVVGLVVTVWWAIRDPGLYGPVLAGYLCATAQLAAIGAWLSRDARNRRLRHERSGLVCIAGWRVVAPVDAIDPDLLLCVALTSALFAHAQLARVAVRGRRRQVRTTYREGLRSLARSWGRGCGVSGARAEALLRDQLGGRYGVVRRVPVGHAMAYRLVDTSLESALARLEQVAAVPLVRWDLGRDPAWDAPDRQ